MALTADQRALLLSPTGEQTLAMVMGRTVGWVRKQRAALITPAPDEKFGSVQRTVGKTLAEFEAEEAAQLAAEADEEAARLRAIAKTTGETREDAADAAIASRRLEEIAQDPGQLVQGEALDARLEELIADDGVIDIEELIEVKAAAPDPDDAILQAAFAEHVAAMRTLIEEGGMDEAVAQVARAHGMGPGFAVGGVIKPDHSAMLVGEQPSEEHFPLTRRYVEPGPLPRCATAPPPPHVEEKTVTIHADPTPWRPPVAKPQGMPEIPATTLRYARWFAAARWRVDSIAHLFDVDPRALAHALAAG